jgi:hypothetical protein
MTASLLMYFLWGSAAFSGLFFLRRTLQKNHPLTVRRELSILEPFKTL